MKPAKPNRLIMKPSMCNRLIAEPPPLNRLSNGIAKSIDLNPIFYINKLHFSLQNQNTKTCRRLEPLKNKKKFDTFTVSNLIYYNV